jgi:hypothetical protein
LEFSQDRCGSLKHVYLMDMNDVYLVVVRLHGWEFMAEASHVNAKKAVRGLAADLQDFYEEGQRSSAAHLMQQGAAAVGVAAIEDARPTGEGMELEVADRRLALKRKAEEWELEVQDRRLKLTERQMALEQQKTTFEQTLQQSIQKQKLELAEHWLRCMQALDPDWRDDKRLCMQARDRLCSAHLIEPRLTIAGATQGASAPGLHSASLTIKEVLDSLRAEIRGRTDDGVLLRVGRTAAQLYAERHGRPPGKHDEMHNGRVVPVNSYTEGDRALLEEAVRRTMTAGSRPVSQFFSRV